MGKEFEKGRKVMGKRGKVRKVGGDRKGEGHDMVWKWRVGKR